MGRKRVCRLCGAPERVSALFSNLSPYSSICVDCINKDPGHAIDEILKLARRPRRRSATR